MPSLHERLGVLGAKCLRLTVETLPESLNNKVSQNDVLATFGKYFCVCYVKLIHTRSTYIKEKGVNRLT